MTKEKKPRRASDSERSSNRGASKRPTSPSEKTSQRKTSSPARKSRARKREDKNTRKRRKTEQAVRKASARTSQRNSSQQKSSPSTSTRRKSSSASTRRTTTQGRNTSPQRKKVSSSTHRTGVSVRNKGASVRSAQGGMQRKRPAQEATARKRQPVKKRKPTAAEIARRKRNRRLLLITLLLLAFLVAVLFTLHYVSTRIQDQATVVLNDEQSSFAPVACTPDILDVSMDVDAPLDKNTPITFTLNLRNSSSDNPCYIDVGRGHTDLDITSGDDPIVSLSTCESAGKEDKQLLIDRNMRTSFTVTWNRHRGDECKANAATALPGVYKVEWKTKGENPIEAKSTFEVKEPPKPTPTESEKAKESEKPQPTG